jgi:hypothetical protein
MSWQITGTEKTPVDRLGIANVSLLLHGNGANGSTTIIDSSPSPKTVTAVGNAQISTAQSKFGGSSIAFDGNGDRLTLTSNSAFQFGTGDFTVEGWFYENSRVQYASALEIGNHLSANGIIFLTNGGNNTANNAGQYAGAFITQIVNGSTATWNHIAWVRESGVFRTFVNGVSSATATPATINLSDTTTITIGSRAGGSVNYDFNGYIDDLRITHRTRGHGHFDL